MTSGYSGDGGGSPEHGEHTVGRGVDATHSIDDREPSPARSAGDLLKEAALMLPGVALLIGRLMTDPRVPMQRKVVAVGAVAYLASPIDVIPDFVPVLGQADDVVIAAFALHRLIESVPPDVREEYWLGSSDTLDLLSSLVAWAAELVPPSIRRLLGA